MGLLGFVGLVGVVTCGATAALDALLPAAASPPPLLSLCAPAPPTTVMLALPAIVKLSVQLSVPLGGRSAGALQTGVGLPGKLAALGMAQKACSAAALPALVQVVVQLTAAPAAAAPGVHTVVLIAAISIQHRWQRLPTPAGSARERQTLPAATFLVCLTQWLPASLGASRTAPRS